MAYLIFMVLTAVALAASITKWKLTKAKWDTPEDPVDAKSRMERIHFLELKGRSRRAQENAELVKLQDIEAGGSGATTPIARLLEKTATWLASAAVSAVLFLTLTIMTSLVIVKEDTTAHFERVWGGTALQAGEIVSRLPMQIFGGGKVI